MQGVVVNARSPSILSEAQALRAQAEQCGNLVRFCLQIKTKKGPGR